MYFALTKPSLLKVRPRTVDFVEQSSIPGRRRRLSFWIKQIRRAIFLILLLGVLKQSPDGWAVDAGTGVELIRDTHFRDGFIAWRPQPGDHVRDCVLTGFDPKASPVWGLDQWNSKFPLRPVTEPVTSGGTLCWSNVAKSVTLAPAGTTAADISLAANSLPEYGPHARLATEPWVHLLVEQEFVSTPAFDRLAFARLHVEAKLLHSRNLHEGDYSSEVHAAQFQIFFTVQNRNLQSPGHGDLLWFGVPLYDNRARLPQAYQARDFGGTAKFIFTPAAETFTSKSTHDADWVTIDRDLLPLMNEALRQAWSKGYLSASTNLADYAIGGMNMGWELPGTFDVAMHIRNLSLQAGVKPASLTNP